MGNPPGWRSHSQVPFDRLGSSQFDTPRSARHSEDVSAEISAQELWLSSQGPSLGGLGGNTGGTFSPDPSSMFDTSRGRDATSRGLQTPDAPYRNTRRPNFDYENGGSGSVSAPLSPHRLYAQLEMGKGISNVPQGWGGYDPRQHVPGLPMPVGSSSFRSPSTSTPGRSGSLLPNPHSATGSPRHPHPSSHPQAHSTSLTASPLHLPHHPHSVGQPGPINGKQAESSLPAFQPFSPPAANATLKQMNGEAGPMSFISPSTLLSPPTGKTALPPLGVVDALAEDMGKMGVKSKDKEQEHGHGGADREPPKA